MPQLGLLRRFDAATLHLINSADGISESEERYEAFNSLGSPRRRPPVWENRAVSAHLKYVDPSRRPGFFSRAFAALSTTRLGRFISAHIVWKIDPYLLRATRGRLGMGLVLPTALLETRGAKSGTVRRNAVIYFHDGDRVTIAASKAGAERHPAWFHNLRANPDVTFGGIAMWATVVRDEVERQRLWALADRVFAPYATYRREAAQANRTIPIVQLSAR